MEPYVRDLFTDEVRVECSRRWGISSFGEKMGASENFVFLVDFGAREAVLRLTHSDRRPREQVESEIEFMRYLHEGGVPVPEILTGPDNSSTQVIDVDKGYFTGVLMERVPGQVLARLHKPEGMPDWIIREWGRATGRMHKLTSGLNRGGKRFTRNHWSLMYEEEFAEENSADEKLLPYVTKRKEILDTFSVFEEQEYSFGLIHTDLHQGNVIVGDDHFTCIDFDDAAYHFFIQDIAMPIYYQFLTWNDRSEERLKHFFQTFWINYHDEYSLDPAWLDNLPSFFRIRDYDLKIVLELWDFPADDPLLSEINRRMEFGNPLVPYQLRDWL